MGSKFLVLTTNRSGSVWVMSTLNGFQEVTAQGELFLPRPRVRERRWDSEFARSRFIESKSAGLSLRPFSVFNYLDALYSTPGTVGFKLMYAQLGLYPEILPYLIWHRIRIIHLVRRNHLDVLLSYTIKAKVGQAHLLAGQAAPEDLRVEMNTKDLVKKMGRLQKKQNLARRLLAWSRLPHLEIAYEDLLSDVAHFDWILNFLAVEPGENSQPSSLVKIRRGGHREVISNYDEVKEVLASSQFASLLE